MFLLRAAADPQFAAEPPLHLPPLISRAFTLKNRLWALSDRISTRVFLPVFSPPPRAPSGENRLENQWIKPTDHLQEIPAARRSFRALQSCLKEK